MLITGANKGIGFEIARQIGRAGHLVLLGARNATLGEAAAAALTADGVDARFMHIDLGNPATIQAAATAIDAKHGRLDVLVNNAGIADRADGPPSKTSIDAVRRIFDTNFFGTLAVTQGMLPLLRKSTSARIVNVSSELGSLTNNSDPEWGNNHRCSQTIPEGAAAAIRLALLPDDGPTGGFFSASRVQPW